MAVANDFNFKRFTIQQSLSNHKVGTDGVLLGAWATTNSAVNILDVGTGTGVIALMLTQRTEALKSRIDAIEIQQTDFDQAIRNVSNSPWAKRVNVMHTSLQRYETERKYQLIVSNPPYFQNSLKPPETQRAIVRHTDSLPFADLIAHSKRLLNDNGRLAVILPEIESRKFVQLATISSLYLRRRCDVSTRGTTAVERILLELSLSPGPIENEFLKLRESGEWSVDYRNLTRDFYLNL